jgi:CheY-like chemotaxis protein
MKKKTIWIIDDDPIYQIIVNKLAKKLDIFSEISSFKNGKEAIDQIYSLIEIIENLPDVILLDINMPVMDGWEFMDEIDNLSLILKKIIVVYIVSSSIAIEDKNKSKSYSNILGYLSKPITINDLELIAHND